MSSKMMRRRRTPRVLAASAGLMDALEPRQLLSSTTVSSGVDSFFADLVRTLESQAGVTLAGFGRSVVNVGDLNGDGADDVAIGSTGQDTALGRVDVYSGKTGDRLWSASGADAGFGRAIVAIADVSGDGVRDIAISSPGLDGKGMVAIYSGADGSLRTSILGDSFGAADGAAFGWSIATGDLNGDAIPDLAIGAPNDGPQGAGRVYLVSADGTSIGMIEGQQAGELFGWAVAVGHTTGQSLDDVMVGAPGWDTDASADNGRVARYRADGTQVFAIAGRDAGDLAGYSVLAIPSNDGSYADLAYGSPGADAWGMGSLLVSHAGIVQIVDADGVVSAIVAGTHTGSFFGASLAAALRPGAYYSPWPLLAIGAPGAPNGGEVQIHDSVRYVRSETIVEWVVPTHTTSTLLHTLHGATDRAFGVALAMGDFNGDGLPDVAASDAPQISTGISTSRTETGTGLVRVYLTVDNQKDYTTEAMSTNGEYIVFKNIRQRMLWLAGPSGVSVILTVANYDDDYAVDVTNSGKVLLSRRNEVQGEGSYFDAWTFENGTLAKLADAVTSFVGAPAEWTFYGDLKPLAILPDGSVIIERFVTNLHSPVVTMDQTIWRVEGGTATYLWRGQYGGHSAAGIVGRRFDSYNESTGAFNWTTMLWRPSAGVEVITTLQNAFAIDDNASIFGVDFATKNMLRRDVDGSTTVLFNVSTEFAVTIYAKAADSSGRLLWMIASNRYSPPGPGPDYWNIGEVRLFDPADSSNTIVGESAIMLHQIAYSTAATTSRVAFTSDGGFLVGSERYANTVSLAHYAAGIDQRLLTPADLATAASATGGTTTTWTASLFVNSLGRLTLMVDEGNGAWRVRNVSIDSSEGLTFDGFTPIVAWKDPLGQRPQFATLDQYNRFVHVASYSSTDSGYPQAYASWEAHSPQFIGIGTDGSGGFLSATIGPSRDMAVLVRPDDNVIIAVRMNDGRVVLVGQQYNSVVNPFSFGLVYDLTYSELEPKGLPTPAFVGPISGFVSPWGGHNITGVDESGHIWTLWTSPEFVGWTITDLTDWLHADPITGGVTSFLTSWNAFNMTGLNSAGELVTMWWAPELGPGNWQVDFIGQGQATWDTGVPIESWFNVTEQSLNFIGKEQSGQTTCYTWSVANQTWRSEIVQPADASDPVASVEPNRGRPSVSGAVGIGESGHLLWFLRASDGNPWSFVDITATMV